MAVDHRVSDERLLLRISVYSGRTLKVGLLLAAQLVVVLGVACSRDEAEEPELAPSGPMRVVVEPRELPRSALGAGARAGSGFSIKTTAAGTGESPAVDSVVTVHYEGRLPDGGVFESSWALREPATFALTDVIPCWREGLVQMRVGGTAKLVCPPELAYGEQGVPGKIPPGATLTFEVALIAVRPAPAAGSPAAADRRARRSVWNH
jgi:FKBP-type peptidyl-prolyl cis-trans isomerase FkpA